MDVQYRGYLEDIAFTAKVRSGMLLGSGLVLMFIGLDAIVVPELFGTFVALRLGTTAVLLVCAVLLARPFGQRHAVALGMVGLFSCVGSIALMVQLMDPTFSTYYQGLTIVLVFMPTYFVWNRRASGLVCAITFLAYAVPTLARHGFDAEGLRIFANNAFFLGTVAVVVYLGSGIMYDARFAEYVSRQKLKAAHAELEATNRKLVEVDRLKTHLFANISHELRTPLMLIMAPLALLLERKPPGEERETLSTMNRNGMKLLKRINELLDLAKLEVGNVRLKVTRVNLGDLVSGAVALARPAAERRRLSLEFKGPSAPVEVPADAEQLEKVVLNLVSNAIKFTPSGGHIQVSVREDGAQACIEVKDDGEGIPPEALERIFDRFAQVDSSPTRRHEGTGLGLALAREIIQLHGGRIWAESAGAGKGATFFVRLQRDEQAIPDSLRDRRRVDQPVAERRRAEDLAPRLPDVFRDVRQIQLAELEDAEIPAAGPDAVTSRHEHKLLVIDDQPEVRHLIKRLLQDEYDVILCGGAEEGLTILRERRPDLVISDVMMPGMDGHTFVRRVRQDPEVRRTPIILVTARAGAQMLAEGLDAGADDFIAKPFEPVELRARVRSLLRMAQAEAELEHVAKNLRIRTDDLTTRQHELFLATVKSLVSALDAKDQYTRNHSLRVTEYSLSIGRKMGLTPSELKDLELASLLHDVGKIGVPEAVLNKPERLTEAEIALIKEHPVKGEAILAPVVELRGVAAIVRSHHEHYDGTGYPDGYKKLQIPLGARIMAVADAYDAMTSDRPYRPGRTHAAAVAEIVRWSGRQFDPEVVQHFLDLVETFRARSRTPVPGPTRFGDSSRRTPAVGYKP